MNVSDGWDLILQTVAKAMEPDPPLHVDAWAEEHITLKAPAAVTGPYRIGHTPMVRRILQALGPADPHTRIVVRGASQLLKTQAAICAIGAWIDLAPANILALEPTDKLAKRLSARLADAIAASDVLTSKVAAPRSRDSRNTIDAKDFDGGTLYIATAGASANLAEIPARYVFLDEIDRMAANVDQEGDPLELAEARTTTYDGRQKVYITSSPTVQDASAIDAQFERGTQENYHVPCPHCAELHPLDIEHFRHATDDNDNVNRAWMICPHCGSEIEESSKITMLPDQAMGGQARWVATAVGDGQTLSFHVNAFYAPLGSISWLSLARQHRRAQDQADRLGNVEPMRVFQNTRLARSYAYTNNTPDSADLQARAMSYAELTVPAGGLLLTAGVDVQHDRLAVVIRAWGREEESWLIYWGELHGQTSNPEAGAWLDLDLLLTRDIPHAYGGILRVHAATIDGSDGSRTDVVNAYVRRRQHLRYMAGKGASEAGHDRREIYAPPKAVDPGLRRKTTSKHGLHTYIVGTNRAKDLILETRIHLTGPGPGRLHAYDSVRGDYWQQIVSEVKVPHGPSRRLRWQKKGGQRNEALDCEVYALHAARSLKINLMREAHWQALEQQLRQRTLLAADPEQSATPLAAPAVAQPIAATVAPKPATPQAAVGPTPLATAPATRPPAQLPAPKRRGSFATNW